MPNAPRDPREGETAPKTGWRQITLASGDGGYLLPPGTDPWPEANDEEWLRLLEMEPEEGWARVVRCVCCRNIVPDYRADVCLVCRREGRSA